MEQNYIVTVWWGGNGAWSYLHEKKKKKKQKQNGTDVLASFPGLPTIQFLITSSMHTACKRSAGKPGNEATDVYISSHQVESEDLSEKQH